MGAYSELAQAAARANAPGNDVFASGDVEREAARLRSLHADFDRRYLEVTRELVRATPPDVHAPLLAALGGANAAFGRMNTEAEAIFAAFRRGDRAEAGAHMATEDGFEARTSSRLEKIRACDLPRNRRVRVVVVLFQALLEQLTLSLRDGQSLAIIDDAIPQLRDQREPARDIERQQVVEVQRRHGRNVACVRALETRGCAP